MCSKCLKTGLRTPQKKLTQCVFSPFLDPSLDHFIRKIIISKMLWTSPENLIFIFSDFGHLQYLPHLTKIATDLQTLAENKKEKAIQNNELIDVQKFIFTSKYANFKHFHKYSTGNSYENKSHFKIRIK